MLKIRPENLKALVAAIIERGGSQADEAALVARHLVGANLAGHDSHGVGLVPLYVRGLGAGTLVANTPARLVHRDGPFLVFDGDRGFGQRVATEAMAAAIDACTESGIVVLALRGTHHVGRVGIYGEQAVAAGLVSVIFVNGVDHDPMVAPFRGTDARFVTNPVCIAVPGGEATPPVILDMATSGIAYGKVKVAYNRGVPVPEGKLIDARGRPTTDPGTMFAQDPRGALLPFGEHKGYGLALACELLAGAVAGGGTIQEENPRAGGVVNNLLAFVLAPGRLADLGWMRREIDAVVAHAKGSPPANPAAPVLVAGDPERLAREARAEGVPIDETTHAEILAAGESIGLAREALAALAAAEPMA
jgi:uncharacterized oxidoreductase